MRKPPSRPQGAVTRKRRGKVRQLDDSEISDADDRDDPVNGPGKDEAAATIKAGERE